MFGREGSDTLYDEIWKPSTVSGEDIMIFKDDLIGYKLAKICVAKRWKAERKMKHFRVGSDTARLREDAA